LEKEKHIFRKEPLSVKHSRDTTGTLFLSDIPQGKCIDEEYLLLYFENAFEGINVKKVEYDGQNGTARIEFNKKNGKYKHNNSLNN
jgi:hypothetical protein